MKKKALLKKRALLKKKVFLRAGAFWGKRVFAVCLCILLGMDVFTGCGSGRVLDDERKDERFSIVTTIFPAYDWVREIMGERGGDAKLTLLLDGGVDMHSYQPTADDIIRIATCDLFIYVGGESDRWVEKVLAAAVNPDMVVINLLDVLGDDVKEEEVVEGMEAGHDHGENARAGDGREGEEKEGAQMHVIEEIFERHEEEGSEMDEHVWLSVRNAEILCGHIASGLMAADPAHAAEYEKNAADYLARLERLDAAFQDTAEKGGKRAVLFADRFPFRYLTDDYGLDYFAAFPGCEAETEASFETVAFLAKKVDELGLSCVLTLENSDKEIARTVISGTEAKNQEVLVMDSMQSVTEEEAEGGTTYLSIMEENRRVLEAALSQ